MSSSDSFKNFETTNVQSVKLTLFIYSNILKFGFMEGGGKNNGTSAKLNKNHNLLILN